MDIVSTKLDDEIERQCTRIEAISRATALVSRLNMLHREYADAYILPDATGYTLKIERIRDLRGQAERHLGASVYICNIIVSLRMVIRSLQGSNMTKYLPLSLGTFLGGTVLFWIIPAIRRHIQRQRSAPLTHEVVPDKCGIQFLESELTHIEGIIAHYQSQSAKLGTLPQKLCHAGRIITEALNGKFILDYQISTISVELSGRSNLLPLGEDGCAAVVQLIADHIVEQAISGEVDPILEKLNNLSNDSS